MLSFLYSFFPGSRRPVLGVDHHGWLFLKATCKPETKDSIFMFSPKLILRIRYQFLGQPHYLKHGLWILLISSTFFPICLGVCVGKGAENQVWGQHTEMLCRYKCRGDQKSQLSLKGICSLPTGHAQELVFKKVLTYFFFPSSLARDLMEV